MITKNQLFQDPKRHMKILLSLKKRHESILATCVQNYDHQTAPHVKLVIHKLEKNVIFNKIEFLISYK